MTDVLVVGESLVDIVQRADGTSVEHAGGSAANVAVALARLGRPVALVTAYADDERGAMLARHLNQSAVGAVGDPLSLDHTPARWPRWPTTAARRTPSTSSGG